MMSNHAKMDVWRPAGAVWRIEIAIQAADPAEIVEKIDYFKAQFLKEAADEANWRKE